MFEELDSWEHSVLTKKVKKGELPSTPTCYHTWSRILDIIICKDKTLVCEFEDSFKQNGINSGQLLPGVRVQTWPKYNKHHHDLKNQLCRFIEMYIGKIFWPTAPCQACPQKKKSTNWGRSWVVFGSFFDSTLLKSVHSLLNSNVTLLTSSNSDWRRD